MKPPQNLLLSQPEDLRVWEILLQCWSSNPRDRPDAQELSTNLGFLLSTGYTKRSFRILTADGIELPPLEMDFDQSLPGAPNLAGQVKIIGKQPVYRGSYSTVWHGILRNSGENVCS